MSRPAKFVGPVYDEPAADRLAASRGWDMRRDGNVWRRVVPSPEPVRIVELALFLHAGLLVQGCMQVVAHGLQGGGDSVDLADACGGQLEIGSAMRNSAGGLGDGGQRADHVSAEERSGGRHGQREGGDARGKGEGPAGADARRGITQAASQGDGGAAGTGYEEFVARR